MTSEPTAGPAGAAEPGGSRLDAARTLFGSPAFRNYWFSSVTFAFGVWSYVTAQGWAASELTDNDAWRVSLTNVVYFLPMFLLALPMGVAADRWDRRVTTITARLTAAVILVVMTVLAATDVLTYPLLLLFAFLVGASVIAEIPARQAYVAQIVPRTHVRQAAALTEVQGGIARCVGPVIAGWLIDVWGPGGGFGMFAGANFAFVWFFFRIRLPGTVPRVGAVRHPLEEMAEGFRYLRGHRDALSVVMVSILAGIVGWVYVALLPVMTREVLDGGAVTYGVLGTAIGLGSIPFSITLALSRGLSSEGRTFAATTVVWGVGVVLFSLSRWVPLSFAALALAGLGFGGQIILVRSILLRIVEPAYHGRVFGTMMLTWGANIIGTLGAGALTESMGVATVVGISGATIIAVVVGVSLWHPRLLRL